MNQNKKHWFWLASFFAVVISAALFTGHLDGELFFRSMMGLLSMYGGEIQ